MKVEVNEVKAYPLNPCKHIVIRDNTEKIISNVSVSYELKPRKDVITILRSGLCLPQIYLVLDINDDYELEYVTSDDKLIYGYKIYVDNVEKTQLLLLFKWFRHKLALHVTFNPFKNDKISITKASVYDLMQKMPPLAKIFYLPFLK